MKFNIFTILTICISAVFIPFQFAIGESNASDSSPNLETNIKKTEKTGNKTGEESGSSGVTEKNFYPGEWEDEDITNLFPEFDSIENLGSDSSLENLKESKKHYNNSIQIIKKANDEINQNRVKWSKIEYPYAWKKSEEEKSQNQKSAAILRKARMNAVSDLVLAIKKLDKVKNPGVIKSEDYLNTKSSIYIQFIKIQYRLNNLSVIIPLLEEYLELKSENRTKAEPFKLLSAAYKQQESFAKNNHNIEHAIMYRELKNKNLRRFAELKYGKESDEYAKIMKKIQLDEARDPMK
ncbi:MAG: hypothetical protein OEZ34_11900 [Spirochaetia bacterium]|nr:hypothetical protein [Spirochaetia bacterium]